MCCVVKLKLGVDGLQSNDGQVFNNKAALQSWRKQNKIKKISLTLGADLVVQHKIYLDKSHDPKRLATLLLREVDQPSALRLNEIYYDYGNLPSSINELAAYQFIYIKKKDLAQPLKFLKQAGISVSRIEWAQYTEFNLLPWREQLLQKQYLQRIFVLIFLPGLILVILMGLNSDVNVQNKSLNNKVLSLSKQSMTEQITPAFTLQQIQPLFLLIKNLKASATLNEAGFHNGKWQVSGSLKSINDLGALNAELIHEGWLKAGESVNLREQDHRYLWQLKKSGLTP